MAATKTADRPASLWSTIPDPAIRYSSGIPDFDRWIGGGFQRGSMALFSMDETVTPADLDLLFFPTYLNFLHQSRGIIAVLPSRDSPHGFRSRLTRYTTRRRFDSRVRVVDYVGEAEGPYVVSLLMRSPDNARDVPARRRLDHIQKMTGAEGAAQGQMEKSFLELVAFEVMDVLVGSEKAAKMFFHGVKRARQVDNLVIGLLGPGVGCAPAVRRMADSEFRLHHDRVGLVVQGVQHSFPSHVVIPDPARGLPNVSLVPTPS